MRFGVFQLLSGVQVRTFIPLVFFKRPKRPRLNTLKQVIFRVEFHEVDRKLSPYDKLLKECFSILGRRTGILNRQRNGVGTDVAKVKIGRKLAGAVQFGMVALRLVTP